MSIRTKTSNSETLMPPYTSLEPPFPPVAGKPLIKPSFNNTFGAAPNFPLYYLYMEEILEAILPKTILSELRAPTSQEMLKHAIEVLSKTLPLLTWSETSGKVCISLLCPADFTHGVGRYLTDVVSRWLIPGKFVGVLSTQSLNFQFQTYAAQNFFMQHILLDIEESAEILTAKAHWSDVERMLRLNIQAVQHARKIVSTKKLTTSQKKALIQENIASLIDRPSKEFDNNVFDQMHHFLIKLSAEEKVAQIRDNFAHFLNQKPTSFDRDIFNEIQYLALLFRDKFTGARDLRHISRIITFQYLFRKALNQEVRTAPKERHLSLKFLPTILQIDTGTKKVLGMLIGINVLSENEMFEERHILSAINQCLKGVSFVKDSYICDRRSQDNVRLFYLEVEKESGEEITLAEIKGLRKQLPRELKAHFENVIHPVVMPRNEEEVMRNIVILSQQLKYIRDIPQVVISFETQTQEHLAFTVVLLRILDKKSLSLEKLFADSNTFLKMIDHEVKAVSTLRKKHVKEANVFRILLDKRAFLRQDYSLDLFKARLAISVELCRILGDIRDFNGGILSKQHEVYHKFKEIALESGYNNEFLLENFFYSITPSLMQSLLSPYLLHSLFLMLLDAVEHEYESKPIFLKIHRDSESMLAMIGSRDAGLKEQIQIALANLHFTPSSLTMTPITSYDICCLGLIFRSDNPEHRAQFESVIRSFT